MNNICLYTQCILKSPSVRWVINSSSILEFAGLVYTLWGIKLLIVSYKLKGSIHKQNIYIEKL